MRPPGANLSTGGAGEQATPAGLDAAVARVAAFLDYAVQFAGGVTLGDRPEQNVTYADLRCVLGVAVAARPIAQLLEAIRDDQVSVSMGFGRTAEERRERRAGLTHYIAQNADKLDEALEEFFAALSGSGEAVAPLQLREDGK